ncbi:hypothetical protein EYY95_12090 [Hafnia alvei]|uniref:hypothetical protein n=1 Tax=Hafnia alvei TaxID=569 RepID=UPI0010335F9E|nr:hypothetical protein [Hafnia alvei]TBL86824.1 hypothetical protein EYY95_12090 [Hafnia alvei]
MQIINFRLIEHDPTYDILSNPDRLSILELMPKTVIWEWSGNKEEITDESGVIAVQLKDGIHIAVVKGLMKNENNSAYIVNYKKKIVLDVKNIIKDRTHFSYLFYDILFINDKVYFFLTDNINDYRVLVDVNSGTVGEMLPSK